jgi:alkaline phosphatase
VDLVEAEPEMMCASKFPFLGHDNSERLLLREGVIEAIPADLCLNATQAKNVILVVGDGMGWEMVRAGAIARRVIDELESLGCDTKIGCSSSDEGDNATLAFQGRTLADYYTEGKIP